MDTNVLATDVTNNRVGIGTSSPQTDLNIVNSSGATLDINSNASAADSKYYYTRTSASPANGASIRYDGANNLFKIGVGSSVDTTRLTIARDTGNVGIGTTSPNKRLHLLSSSINKPMIKIESTGTNSYPGFQVVNDAQTWEVSTHGGHSDALTFYNGTTHTFALATNGNVGIGTTSPATLLDVSGTTPTITISDSQNKSWTSSDTIYGKVSFKTLDSSGIGNHETAYIGVHADVASSTTPAGRLVFGTSNSNSAAAETMTLDGNGFLGLGTSNPSALLTMTGNSDTSDESCMIILNDEDTDVGSQVPAMQFRGNDGNIGRLRANGSLGLILSGSSAQGDDLVVQAGAVGIGTTSPSHTSRCRFR